MPLETLVILTPDGVYRMSPERILTADQYVAMMSMVDKPAPVLNLGAGNFVTKITWDGNASTIAIRAYGSIKIPMAVECVRKRIETTDVETITLAASLCNESNPVINPILHAPDGFFFILMGMVDCELARMMLYHVESGKFYALPLSNFWDDGRICLGEGYTRTAHKAIDDIAGKVMNNTPNDHLIEPNTSKFRNRHSLFQFTADLEWIRPASGNPITEYCIQIDDAISRNLCVVLKDNPSILSGARYV